MIIKPLEMPLQLLKLKALIRRTPVNHPQMPMIQAQLSKRMAGYQGEYATRYPLSFLPDKSYFIFHDLRLQTEKHYFQMDTLVICKKFMMILEVKNMAGSLFFDRIFHQLIRTKDNQEETFPDPILQVHQQEMKLRQWLTKMGIPQLPIIPLVVISNPSATIRTAPENKNLHKEVVRREYLPTKFVELEDKYKEEKLTDKQMKKLVRLYQKFDQPLDRPILERFNINQGELLTGVHCPSCDYVPMIKTFGSWLCPSCSRKTKGAYVSSLEDYYLLISSSITNAEARDFLQIKSRTIVNRFLHEMELTYTGENKGRVYDLAFANFKKKAGL